MAEMPARVDAVAGATVVEFPWPAAGAAVTALNRAVTTLGSQLDTRALMLPGLAGWEGTYHDDFEAARSRVETTASGLREALASLASSIVSGAEGANAEQALNSTRAEDAAAEAAATRQAAADAGPVPGA